jgi:hypothetical protein
LFRDVVLQWFEVFEVFICEPLAVLGVDIQHFFFATEVLPRIFPKNFWIKGKNSFFWNPENNPFFFFDRSLDYVFLRGNLLSPYLFLGDKYRSVVHITRHLMVYAKAPIRNTAILQEIF